VARRKRGRPPRQWKWLVHDVDCIRRERGCSVQDACGYLADGAFSEILPVRLPPDVIVTVNGREFLDSLGPCKIVWGKWKGMKIKTLERKYHLTKARVNGNLPQKNRPD